MWEVLWKHSNEEKNKVLDGGNMCRGQSNQRAESNMSNTASVSGDIEHRRHQNQLI